MKLTQWNPFREMDERFRTYRLPRETGPLADFTPAVDISERDKEYLVKAQLPLGPVISVGFETMLLAPVAALWLWGVHTLGWHDIGGASGGAFGRDWTTSALLAGVGIGLALGGALLEKFPPAAALAAGAAVSLAAGAAARWVLGR